MFSPSLSWVFTVVFLLTGAYSLVRLAEIGSGSGHCGSKVVELSHLLMSIAMIAMAWAWTGDASSPSGVLQIVVFGLFAVSFLVRLVWPAAGRPRVGEGYHLVMNAAMVWMVAAMPLIMGMTPGAGNGGAHDHGGAMAGMPGMGATSGMSGMGAGSAAPAPIWASVVSWVLVVLLAAAALLWATRLVRRGPADAGPLPAAAIDPVGVSGATENGAVAVTAPVAPARATAVHLDAGCHLLMCLGMAGMLLAML